MELEININCTFIKPNLHSQSSFASAPTATPQEEGSYKYEINDMGRGRPKEIEIALKHESMDNKKYGLDMHFPMWIYTHLPGETLYKPRNLRFSESPWPPPPYANPFMFD